MKLRLEIRFITYNGKVGKVLETPLKLERNLDRSYKVKQANGHLAWKFRCVNL